MLRTDARVIETCRHRMRLAHLAERVLKDQRIAALKHSGCAERQRGGIVAESRAAAARLHAENADARVAEEWMEQADGVRAAADAGNHRIGQTAGGREHLRARLAADHRLQLAHQVRIRMRSHGGAQRVIRAVGIGHPVAQRLVDRRAQRLVAGAHRHDGGAHELHAPDIRRLALNVDLAHVDDAGQAQPGGGGGARNAVLPRAGLGDDALRAEALGEQRLADGVVDFVRAGMRKVFALEPDVGAPAGAQRGGVRQGGGAAHPGLELMVELRLEIFARQVTVDARLQPIERRHQGFGHVAPAECTESALRIGACTGNGRALAAG